MICPRCLSANVQTERRPDGYSKCLDCSYEKPTKEFSIEKKLVNKKEKVSKKKLKKII